MEQKTSEPALLADLLAPTALQEQEEALSRIQQYFIRRGQEAAKGATAEVYAQQTCPNLLAFLTPEVLQKEGKEELWKALGLLLHELTRRGAPAVLAEQLEPNFPAPKWPKIAAEGTAWLKEAGLGATENSSPEVTFHTPGGVLPTPLVSTPVATVSNSRPQLKKDCP